MSQGEHTRESLLALERDIRDLFPLAVNHVRNKVVEKKAYELLTVKE